MYPISGHYNRFRKQITRVAIKWGQRRGASLSLNKMSGGNAQYVDAYGTEAILKSFQEAGVNPRR